MIINYYFKYMKRKVSKYYIYIGFILVSILLGFIRYSVYQNPNFKLFKNKEKIEIQNREKFDSRFDEARFNAIKTKDFYHYSEDIVNYINFSKADLYNKQKSAIFIDARAVDEIKENSRNGLDVISDAIIIPMENIEIIYDETDFFYEDVNNEDLEFLKLEYSYAMDSAILLKSLPKDICYIIYCGYYDCDKSERLAEVMQSLLFEKIGLYKDGWQDWVSKKQ